MAFRIENAKCITASDKAICVEAPIFDEPQWIPQSQVDDDSEVWRKGDEGDLIISDWFAHKKEWSDE
jgi:hypothetical protein